MPSRSRPPSQQASGVSSPTSPIATPSASLNPLGSVKATLRLPKPPLPPKPLYLTVRAKRTVQGGPDVGAGQDTNRQTRTRGELPTWVGTLRAPEGSSVSVSESDVEGEEDEPATDRLRIADAAIPVRMYASESAIREGATEHAADADPVDDRGCEKDADEAVASIPAAVRDLSFASSSSSQFYSTPVGTLRLETAADENNRYSTIRFRNEDGQLHIFFDPHLHNPFVPSPPSFGTKDEECMAEVDGADIPAKEESSMPDASTLPEAVESVALSALDLLPLPAQPLPAVALHDFEGMTEHGELSFSRGQGLRIEVEDVGGGWSLGFTTADGEVGRGLMPRAWYAYVDAQDDGLAPETAPARLIVDFARTSASHSIKHRVVVSGTEFEPTWHDRCQSTGDVDRGQALGDVSDTGDAAEGTRSSGAATTLVSAARAAAVPALPLLRLLGSTFRASLPLNFAGLVVPGASILAATSAPTFSTESYARRRRLPRLEAESKVAAELSKAHLLQWIEEGDALDDEISEAMVTFDIEPGPLWRRKDETMSYRVVVSSSRKVNPVGERPHVVYFVTTTFAASPIDEAKLQEDELEVARRFSDFVALDRFLRSRFYHPLVLVPALPPRHDFVLGDHRFEAAFIEERRVGLQSWLEACVRHPVLSASEELKDFLALPELQFACSPGDFADLPLFPARVFHPEFNVDVHDAALSGRRFSRVIDQANLEQSLSHMRKAMEASIGMRRARYDTVMHLSDALATGIGATRNANLTRPDRSEFTSRSVSATLRNASTLLSGFSRSPNETESTALHRYERYRKTIKDMATHAATLLDLHTAVLARYEANPQAHPTQSEALARIETVLNITSAEMAHAEEALVSQTRGFLREWLDRLVRDQEQDLLDTRSVLALFGPET